MISALFGVYVVGAVLAAGVAYGTGRGSCAPGWIVLAGLTWPLWVAIILVGHFLPDSSATT